MSILLISFFACHSTEKVVDTTTLSRTDTSDSASTTDTSCDPGFTRIMMEPTVVDAQEVTEWGFQNWQIDAWLSLNGLSWLSPTAYSIRTWRIRYTTQDHGQQVEATALVSVPIVNNETSVGTVLWMHGTSGYTDACAPSIGAVEGVVPALIAASRGYVTVAPDYLGMNAIGSPADQLHPWIVGEPSGIVALDALRAVDQWLPQSGALARVDRHRIVYWGWSEGGFTAMQADRRAPDYASDYMGIGIIAAVPPLDIVGQVRDGMALFGPATKANAIILAQHANWYGQGNMTDILQPEVAAALPTELAASCGTWPSVDTATSVNDIFLPEFSNAMTQNEVTEPWRCMLSESSLPNKMIPYASTAPVLLITGDADTLVLPEAQRSAITDLCTEGYKIEHISCSNLDHNDTVIATLRAQVAWLTARMAGEPIASGCGVSTPIYCDE